MLLGMWRSRRRDLAFTVLVALLCITGHATGAEGQAVEAYDAEYVDTDPSAVEIFRPELEPHGMWVEDPVYGLVWFPNPDVVGTDFVPYLTAGYWGYTAEGDYIWVSDYEWGWAVFHYGRWVWIPNHGWAWIPGRTYAPAWVVWRVGHPGYAYVGWAPMPPSYYWYGGVAVSLWVVPPPYYVYCESRYVFTRHVHSYRLHGRRAHEAARYTAPYRPARPSTSPGRHAARPSRGPAPGEAGIPADAVPRTPAKPHPRAAAAATPTSGPGNRPSAANNVRSSSNRVRSPSTVPGVSQPVYRGRPSQALPSQRRAAPLASRPSLPGNTSRGNSFGSPRESRTLGATTVPSGSTPSPRERWSGPASRGGTAPSAPSARPPSPSHAAPSGHSSGHASGHPGYRSTTPARSPSGSQSAGPSRHAPSHDRSSREAPSYDRSSRETPSSRPSYGAPSRPSYSGPTSRPSDAVSRPSYGASPSRQPQGAGQGNSNNNNNNNNNTKSQGRGKARGGRR